MLRRTLGIVAVMAALAAPAPAAAQSLQSLQITPAAGGPDTTVSARVTLSGPAPAGGAYVQLSAPSTVWIPGTVVVPQGSTVALFPVSVNRSATNGEATIVASWRGQQVVSNKLGTRADAAMAQQAAQARAEAQAAAAQAPPVNWDPYGWGYGYGYGYGRWYPNPQGPRGGPVAPPGTYTPVSPTPTIGSYQGMGGVPSGPVIDMGGGVPRL